MYDKSTTKTKCEVYEKMHNKNLTKQNQLIIICYFIFYIFYLVSVVTTIFSYNHYFTLGSGLFFALIYLLFNANVPPKIIQACIIVCLNVLILLLIFKTIYILNVYSLIYYLILIGLYQSLKLLLATSIVISIEFIVISFTHFQFSLHYSHDFYIFIALTVAMLLIGAVQTIFIQYKAKTDEKLMELEIQKNTSKQAYLQLFFEYANDAIAVFDLNNKIIEVNPAFEALYGWTKEECIGNSLPLVPPKRIGEAIERYDKLLEGESFIIESEEMKKDGTIFNAQLSLSPIFSRDGKVFAISVISRDISYRKEHERLQMQSEKLRLAGEIAAGVAHEIRNPMTVISSFVQMMQADENSPYKSYVEIVQDEIERIDLIISEFLVLSKPQIKDKEWVNLIEIIQNISAFYQLEFQAKSIYFELIYSIDEAFIYGNKNQLKQVFINLIKNAMEAIDHNGAIKITLSKQESSYLITIQDNGSGISDEILNRIFEPFYTTKTKGTGLGMMITNKIVQDHFGSIKVFSKENVGTDVHIQFAFNQQI